MADYPTDYYYDIIRKQPNFKNLTVIYNITNLTSHIFKSSILLVNVYYQDLTYNAILESPALMFADVLGVIGGNFLLLNYRKKQFLD